MSVDREERQSALDEFAARSGELKPVEPLGPVEISHAPPPDLMEGPRNIKPRDIGTVLNKIRTLAAAAGDDWYYRIPFKDNRTGRTTWVEGPSKTLTNAVIGIYGNCRVHPWVSAEGLDYWEITAIFVDYETGSVMARPFRQRKNAGKIGGDDTLRKMEIAFAIGVSKASRNVIVNALETYCDFGYEEARNALVDKIGNDLENWRVKVSERIGAIVPINRVEAVIGRAVADWLAPDIAKIAVMGKTIKDGMATVDETFPPLASEKKDTGEQLDGIAKGSSADVATKADASPAVDQPGDKPSGVDPSPDGKKAAAKRPPVQAAADPRKKATDKFFELASDHRLSAQERLEKIDEATPQFEDDVSAAFLRGLVDICARLAKGEIKQNSALKEAEALP